MKTRDRDREQEILCDFLSTFVQMTEVPEMLGYAAPYARTLVLSHGIETEDYVIVGGRYFVSRAFLEELSVMKGRSINNNSRKD